MAEVKSPLIISSRLMAALEMPGVGTIHLSAIGRDVENRVEYEYIICDKEGAELFSGRDLRSGVWSKVDYTSTMDTILVFILASAEEGESSDLFPMNVVKWAMENEDELSMWQLNIEER